MMWWYSLVIMQFIDGHASRYPPERHLFSRCMQFPNANISKLLLVSSESSLLLLSLHFLKERITLLLLFQLLIATLILLHVRHILTTRQLTQSTSRSLGTLLLFPLPTINTVKQVINILVISGSVPRVVVDTNIREQLFTFQRSCKSEVGKILDTLKMGDDFEGVTLIDQESMLLLVDQETYRRSWRGREC
jgi:hypothetical protein